jgi:hypothetical protein
MPSSPKNIVELRRALSEKFPGVKMSAEPRVRLANRWPTGVAALDQTLDGGLAKSAVTELVSPGTASGSALIVAALLEQAFRNGQWLALIDTIDSFDPSSLHNSVLERLLWMRCTGPRQALKAADLILHDGSPAIVILDLALCPLPQLRKTPSSTWFRLARLVENTATALLVLTPEPMISPAETRLRLERRFSLQALELNNETLLAQLGFEPIKTALRIVKSA